MATKTATAPAKANGNGKAQANEPTWHGQYDARIAKANGALGTVPTADAYRAALTLGPAKGKRPGVEALWIAMTLRPEGASIAQYTAAGECRTANNWLQYLNDEGNRHVYKQVHVNVVGGVRYTRLTARGVAHCMTQGMPKGALERLAKPFTPPKGVALVKPAGKPVAAPAKPASKRKPAGAPIQAPAPQAAPAAPQAPRTVLTNEGPKVIQPQPQPATADSK